jgi:RimJ/RimL family protein N-acetyltransferase
MKPNLKTNPESFFHRDLNGKGYIRLVRYYDSQFPHIEYGISDGSRYQGIMSKELPKYLNDCSKQGHEVLLAIVMPNNIPSIKLLNKNNFVFFKNLDGKLVYIWSDLLKKIRWK